MWERINNFWNRLGNTAMVLPRLGWTVVNTGVDAINAVVTPVKDVADVVQYTADGIRNVLIDPQGKWKWYERVWNAILSPFVAAWAAIQWAVKAAVTPIVNWAVNGRNTVKNAVKNTWRSTFGRVFSKKPLSDFSYDQLKTANIIDKKKNWFLSKWFSRKSRQWGEWRINEQLSEPKSMRPEPKSMWPEPKSMRPEPKSMRPDVDTSDKSWNVAAGTAIAATAWSAASSLVNNKKHEKTKSSEWIKNDLESLKKQKDEIEKQIEKILETEKWDSKWKPEKVENTDSKIEWKSWGKTEKSDSKPDEKKSESLDKEAKRVWLNKAKDLLKDSPCGQKIIDWLCEKYEDFWVIFDDTTCNGRHNKDSITVGTKMPEDKNMWGLAPLNRETKDKEYQVKHVLLHELAHCTVSHKDKIPEVKEWLDIIKKYIEKDDSGKTLSLLTYKNKKYDSSEAKAKEDLVEMFALRMNWDWKKCKEYMELLSSDEKKDFRNKYGLATVSKEDADKLQKVCDAMAKFYEK